MSSASASAGRSSNKTIAAVVLAVIGVVLIIVGVIYFAEPAKSLPSFLGTITHPAARADTNRPLRGAVSLVVAAICLAAAWFTARNKQSGAKPEAAESAKAGSNR